jgi:hypothetical protein
MIAGSLLGAVLSLLVGRPREVKKPILARIRRQRPRTRAQQFFRGVTRTVGGMIK